MRTKFVFAAVILPMTVVVGGVASYLTNGFQRAQASALPTNSQHFQSSTKDVHFSTISDKYNPMLSAQATSGDGRLSAPVTVLPSDFGLNVAEWDSAMNTSSTIPTIQTLGTGMQRFPNNDAWSWKLNRSRNGSDGYKSWNTFTSPFSLKQWGAELQATSNQGIFNINYGMNSTWNGGQSIADVEALTHNILDNHIPVKAMVVGSETFFSTTINLRADKSAQEYAKVSKQMAIAIHKIDPNMMVGVSLSAGTNGHMSSADVQWNDTVLRMDSPYIQFVTFHVYPIDHSVTSSGLLNTLAADLPQLTSTIRYELLTNAGRYAPNIQVWFTEFNLFLNPRPQTTEQVGGAAMLESMLLARSLGVQQIDVWSLHGGAHALLPNGQVATAEVHQSVSQYGTFALAGDGQAPEPAMNTLYPTGQALSKLTALVRGGAKLQVEKTAHLFAAKIVSGNKAHWVLVNMSEQSKTVHVGGQAFTIPPANYQIVATAASDTLQSGEPLMNPSVSAFVSSRALAATASAQAPPAIPQISGTSVKTITSHQVLTLSGSGFGSSEGNGYLSFSNNGVNWGSPQNFYKLTIIKWTDNQIQFMTPSENQPNGSVNLVPGTTAQVTVFANGQEASNTLSLHVQDALAASLSSAQIKPGQVLTVIGQGFGKQQGTGYVQFSDHGVNWGSPSNFYKLKIVSWKDNAVSFVVPTQHIVSGTKATVRIMTANNTESMLTSAEVSR